jgi:hypothetical protein
LRNACDVPMKKSNISIKQTFYSNGVNHGYMPIVLLAVSSIQYHYLIMTNLKFN